MKKAKLIGCLGFGLAIVVALCLHGCGSSSPKFTLHSSTKATAN